MSEAITRGDDNEKPSKDVSLTKGKMIDMKGYGTPRRALGDLKMYSQHRPEQRVDIADLLHSVQCDNRFLRSLFSELLDEDGLKLLNEKNPMTNNDCDKALTEIFGGEISRQ
ncbi:hypothetical protein DINM_006546 [Dirofilaria immitis]|nr:hypothetical protein [Dirofilaria immitis]